MKQLISFLLNVLLIGTCASGFAGELDIPNQFSAGTPAVADEVNANFTAVETSVDGNAADIANLMTVITTLQATVNILETDNIALQEFITNVLPHLSGGTDAQGQPAVFFSGAHVHVNNGEGSTDIVNGTGNLIVGYNEIGVVFSFLNPFCTEAQSSGSAYNTQEQCENVGGIWGTDSQKTGSHNLIVGRGHSYTQYGGLVAGFQNTSAGAESSVIGGSLNTAISKMSSISGGQLNIASGTASSVSGGRDNTASGVLSNVSGGRDNIANSNASSVSGGQDNTASGEFSSVSGGNSRTAQNEHDWVSGSLVEDF